MTDPTMPPCRPAVWLDTGGWPLCDRLTVAWLALAGRPRRLFRWGDSDTLRLAPNDSASTAQTDGAS